MLAGLVSSEASLLGLHVAIYSLSSVGLHSMCLHVYIQISSFYKDPSLTGLRPTLKRPTLFLI